MTKADSRIILPPSWHLPDASATAPAAYYNRRRFMRMAGAGIAGAALLGCSKDGHADAQVAKSQPPIPADVLAKFPAKRNTSYKVDRALTPENVAGRYNNFYEFTTDKERVHELAKNFRSRPWTLEIAGQVKKPQVIDIDKLIRELPQEERVYRFRCVEAWAMVVPWTGIPLSALLKRVEPLGSAKYLRLVSFNDPEQSPGVRSQPWYPWPYFEGLRIDEAMNELAMLVTGIYGKPLPPQHGAPLRLITPWKYGFKSAKSIVRIELTDKQPPTFWNQLAPTEYSFLANVNPKVPHPRWSQATERMIDTGKRVPTQPYNGYGKQVAALYKS